jgi:hypothetical protein
MLIGQTGRTKGESGMAAGLPTKTLHCKLEDRSLPPLGAGVRAL